MDNHVIMNEHGITLIMLSRVIFRDDCNLNKFQSFMNWAATDKWENVKWRTTISIIVKHNTNINTIANHQFSKGK